MRARGMTLIEVLLATVLLGVGVAGLMLSAALGLRNQQRSDRRAAALYLAQEKLASIDATGPHIWSLTERTRGTEVRDGAAFDWTVRIEEMTAGELFDVNVEVAWADAGGGRVQLETWVNDYAAATSLTPTERERKTPMEANRPAAE